MLKQLKEFVDDIENSEIRDVRSLLFELEKVFKFFIGKGLHKVRKNHTEQEQTVRRWINGKYEEFYSIVFQIWNKEDKDDKIVTLKLDTLDYVFNFLCEEAKNMTESYFPSGRFRIILNQLLHVGNDKDIEEDGTISEPLLNEFKEKYLNEYWDLKFYFYQEFINVTELNSVVFAKFLTITKECELYDLQNRDSITEQPILIKNAPTNTIYNFSSFRINFEKSWIYALNKENNLNKIELLATLTILHKRIIPYFSNAQKLMDFLTASYTLGLQRKEILISILSLNGLWELMKTFNLDYPDFYKNLYKILTPDLLHLKEKSRFFRLLELFMSSTHLSSSIVASFIKRLSRLSLTAPPSGIIIIIPFIYNLIKKYGHSTCILLLHSTTSKEEDENYIDPYDPLEEDPALSGAIESSIWELETMINHYHPNVSSLIKILHQKFTKFGYNTEDFLDWSYEKLLDSEMNKSLRGEIGLEFEKWDKLFDNEGYLIEYTY
ncbi:hypothetical protein CANINC_000955 [Pichia inconspicua]|uniref:CCAAT-binding factor domain-containing protein n=1 Tax=Pichia inconspicua TaxID=52247 RepID=A0A4T0X6H2_9ASCO|nr:hypothetical protein CANINC_000955 [[Candida] inconspicua]